jgi:hypothetical protein
MFDEHVYNRDAVGERYWIMGYMIYGIKTKFI